MPSPLAALSPLDGRYARTADPLRAYFSEQALIRYRVRIELAWLEALAAERAIRELRPFSPKTRAALARLVKEFSAREGTHRRGERARQDERRRRQLQRARRRVSGVRLGALQPSLRRAPRSRIQRLYHPDRAARLAGRALGCLCARQQRAARPRPRR